MRPMGMSSDNLLVRAEHLILDLCASASSFCLLGRALLALRLRVVDVAALLLLLRRRLGRALIVALPSRSPRRSCFSLALYAGLSRGLRAVFACARSDRLAELDT